MRRFTKSEVAALLRLIVTSRRFLKQAPYLSRDEMQAWQIDRVRKLVTHAYETVPFYRALYGAVGFEPGDLKDWQAFERLPRVTKGKVIESYPDEMLSSAYSQGDLIVSRSSGSSGKVMNVAYPAATLAQYALATIRMYAMGFDYRPWHRHAYVYTSPYPFDSVFGLYPLYFIPTLTPIPSILEKLVEVEPHLLVCHPSHLRQIAEMASARDLRRIQPLLVSVSSELSSEAERTELSRRFGCPVLDNYSSEELARIAAQCLAGTYHVFDDMNLVEVLGDDDAVTKKLGRVVGTNLRNFAMPLIRYEQDDYAMLSDRRCPCGRLFRVLSGIEGRRNDSFTMPSGRALTSGFLLDATYEFLLDEDDAVRDYCLIQEAADSVLLEIVPGRGWSESAGRRITARFQRHLEAGVRFRILEVAECEKTRTGKRNPIISRVPSTRRVGPEHRRKR